MREDHSCALLCFLFQTSRAGERLTVPLVSLHDVCVSRDQMIGEAGVIADLPQLDALLGE